MGNQGDVAYEFSCVFPHELEILLWVLTVFVDCKGGGVSCKDDTIPVYLESMMKLINQYSFTLMVAVVLLIFVVFTLRAGPNWRHLIALGALSLGIVLTYRFLKPGASSSADVDRILAEIHSGSPVLLEFQSPY
jgi:hypothetical protein